MKNIMIITLSLLLIIELSLAAIPDSPTNPSPNGTLVGISPTLSITVTDPDSTLLNVTFYILQDEQNNWVANYTVNESYYYCFTGTYNTTCGPLYPWALDHNWSTFTFGTVFNYLYLNYTIPQGFDQANFTYKIKRTHYPGSKFYAFYLNYSSSTWIYLSNGLTVGDNSEGNVSVRIPADGLTNGTLQLYIYPDYDGSGWFYYYEDMMTWMKTVTEVSNNSAATTQFIALSGNMNYTWYADVSDGTNTTTSSSWAFTTANQTNPEMMTVRLVPQEPFNDESLSCYANATASLGLNISYEGIWYRNGGANSTFNTTFYPSGIEELVDTKSGLLAGDNWSCSVRTFDGILRSNYLSSNQINIHSYPQIINISINSTVNTTGANLICLFTSQNDDNHIINYTISFYKNLTQQGTSYIIESSSLQNSYNITGATKGNWSCGVFASHLTYQSPRMNSSEIIIYNTKPTISITINPTPALSNSTLNCSIIVALDDNNDSLSYEFNWTINDNLSDTHTQTLDPGNFTGSDSIICYARAYDGTDYSEWNSSQEVIIDDVTPPALSNWSITPDSPYNDEIVTISVDCVDESSNIETGYPRVTFRNTNDLTLHNFTMIHSTGNTYTKLFTFSEATILYNNFTFYCQDTNGNMQINQTNLSITSKTRPGGGDGGAGAGGETREVFVTANQSNFCGDNICGEGEDPTSCNKDCKVNFDTLVTCLFKGRDTSMSCNWDQAWFPVALLVFVLVVGAIGIFISQRRRKKE